jgi:chromodomain-helicase-DNA-binding protein 1
MDTVVYLGDLASRRIIQATEFFFDGKGRKIKFNILITTYETIISDYETLGTIRWAALIVDEAQRLKNDASALYQRLFEFRSSHRVLITGTPLQVSHRFVRLCLTASELDERALGAAPLHHACCV